jgi:hypothetical protein
MVSKGAAGGARRDRVRPGATGHEPTTVGEGSGVDAGAAVAPVSTDTALRHPTTKPRVQLDPNNPWP